MHPLTLALVFLILRVVAIEYRGRRTTKWIRNWNIALSVSSFFIALLVGAAGPDLHGSAHQRER